MWSELLELDKNKKEKNNNKNTVHVEIVKKDRD